MSKRPFDKELFKRSVVYNVKTLYRQTIEEASPRHIFNAVALATKDAIIDAWLATQEQMKKQDPKIVYYMSMEFLMGRALGNNLINLTYYDEVKEALQELGCDPEPDRRSGARRSSWKRRSGKTGSLFPGFSGYPGLCGLRLRNPLPLRYVQAED